MKKITNFTTLFILSFLVLFSCQNEDIVDVNQDILDATASEAKAKLQDMNFNTSDFEVIDFVNPDQSVEKMFRVEGDIVFSKEHIDKMYSGFDKNSRQYNTNYLVNTNGGVRNIKIKGLIGSLVGLSSKEQTALKQAVANYNNLNINIHFNLSFASLQSFDDEIVVYNTSFFHSNSGGQAGFPSYTGNPFRNVQIYNLDGFSTDVSEHVLTHEIGHSIGFRHTDWFSRQSCGAGTANEGVGFIGANHIPGTPTGFDANSLMNACFRASTNGEFNSNDKTALRYLY